MEAKIPSASPMPLFPWLSRSWWAKMQEACWLTFSTLWSLRQAINFLGLSLVILTFIPSKSYSPLPTSGTSSAAFRAP